MWRWPATRAYLRRLAVVSKLHHPTVHSQVSSNQILISSLQPDELLFRFSHSWASTRYRFCQNNRFFSSNAFESYQDSPSESPDAGPHEAPEDFDFSSTSTFAENTVFASSEFESADSIFEEGADSLGVDAGFGERFVGEMVMEDEGIGVVKENDPDRVESLLSLLQSRGTVTGSLESHLEEMGLLLNEEFVLKVVATPCVPAENLIGFAKWALRKLDFKVTTQVLGLLVSTICQEDSKRDAYALWDFVNEVGGMKEGLVTTVSLNELIGQFSRLGKGKAAFDVFNKFEEFGCLLNADSYYSTIEALCKRSFYDWAFLACEKMLEADKLPDSERVGKIISYLCKGDRAKDAHLIYLYAKDKKISPPRSSINFLICSLSRIRRIKQTDKGNKQEIDKELDKEIVSLALEMLKDYPGADRKSAIQPFSSVLKKLCWIKDFSRAKELLLEMIDAGPPPGNSSFNYVINGLTKAGDMDEALKIMEIMKSRGLKPDVYTYSVIMSGYARDGAMEEACKMYDEAKKKHSKLSPITYHTLIRGFCRLEQFDKAVEILGEMKQYGVQPSHDEYNKLIKSLCLKALDWETAERLRDQMGENNLNSSTGEQGLL
ncbi:pentatricopeptide repeat-containing protein mitochondrial-like [Dorcoceras hygrometricum]|uniref:Pentatricopeptide repeat-containing protein mitochondrial-like n=1 Tax=Dorcoceras hygrometricum TaxID=472368 RepID=A0A2Z7B483_9LAMI|nr:pentatricopeptide repeat-containing protein mitochondrial-like [Dorcoceras hygrometricum]